MNTDRAIGVSTICAGLAAGSHPSLTVRTSTCGTTALSSSYGDAAEAQNGFGNWMRVNYRLHHDQV
jgi:hypothetical protein